MPDRIDVSKVLVQNSDGKFLVVQKSEKYDWKAGKWELPGEKIEEHENRFEAGRRELKAETGLKPKDLRDLVRVEVEEFSDKTDVNCWILYTKSFAGNIGISNEHQKYEWVSAEEFTKLEWHRDAGYAIPAMNNIEEYLE